jgi:hypothetical protein
VNKHWKQIIRSHLGAGQGRLGWIQTIEIEALNLKWKSKGETMIEICKLEPVIYGRTNTENESERKFR